ncbi:NAD/NADP-dependent octopine/nopaline dehydrogenase family protein [Fluviispira vulneris]|uniref:NAD/NADP-dependent octopine/nopaline dehydrogenase family protein n=1 Tax=Fluviispira vulneris TaxID=2763012 RepID=UPI0016442241|nr:NAD/NADP-dependent octopine/nopaline dehydrogenase family protein [Fluviispira vulneris]
MKKIAVIGCGHGGQALAGHFSILGHSVNLYAHPRHLGGYEAVNRNGGVQCQGVVQGFGKLNLVTTNIEKALKNTEYIFIALPVPAHEAIFINMLPYIESNQIVINLSGHFSGIFQYDILKRSGWEKEILIADITSFPYACRSEKPSFANILAIKNKMGISSLNYSHGQEIKTAIQDFFPCELVTMSSFIETGLYDPCGISHPPSVLFNAGRIGNKEEYYFYKDGVSIETARFLEKIDEDRINIGKNLGFKLPPYYQVMNDYYGLSHKSIYDFFKNSPIHNKNKLNPKSLNDRYISEDVPFSLVPWYSLGQSAGYESSAMRNIIDITSILNQVDYLSAGRIITKDHLKAYKICG